MTLVLRDIQRLYQKQDSIREIIEKILQNNSIRILLKGLSGSSVSVVTSEILRLIPQIHFFIFTDKEEAAYFYNDLLRILDQDKVLFFPSSYKRSIQYNQIDNGQIILRTNVLSQLSNYEKGLLILVTYPEALFEKVPKEKTYPLVL